MNELLYGQLSQSSSNHGYGLARKLFLWRVQVRVHEWAELLGNIGEFVGSIAVLATLIYLAIQVRQSNASDRMNTTLNIQSSYNEVGSLFLGDSSVMSSGFSGLSALSQGDQLKFAVVLHLYFGHIELVKSYEERGMLDHETLNRTYSALRYYLQLPGVQEWWATAGSSTFSERFVEFVERQSKSDAEIKHDW